MTPLAEKYGSEVVYSQVKEAIEGAGGTIIPLPTIASIDDGKIKTIKATDRPCIAEFPSQESFQKFLDSVKDIQTRLDIEYSPIQPDGKVSVHFQVPMDF